VPSLEFVFTVKLPVDTVWTFMDNRSEIGCLFPGCKDIKILNELDSLWTVSFSLGPFSRTLVMKGHTTEQIVNRRISWTATHELFAVSGMTNFREISQKETEITYLLEARATGSLTFLQDIIIGEKMREAATIFINNIKERLNMLAEKEN
jgi:carbon monoxide dehydrogenase subunit G